MTNLLRKVLVPSPLRGGIAFVLTVWDTYERDRWGKSLLRYDFRRRGAGVALFAGSDFACSPMDAIDSDRALLSLLGFLCMRLGDTDASYFEWYTEAQREWCESYECEALQVDVCAFVDAGGEGFFTDIG